LPRGGRNSVVEEAEDTVADFLVMPEPAEVTEQDTGEIRTNPYIPQPYRTLREHHPEATNYAGRNTYKTLDLIQLAFKLGFRGFTYSNIQLGQHLNKDGKPESIALATVGGVFVEPDGTETYCQASADATPSNCMVSQAYPRMAETRAQGRLLRTAMGMDANAAEEFSSEDEVIRPVKTKPTFSSNGTGGRTFTNPEPNSDSSVSGYECEECGVDILGKDEEGGSKKYTAAAIAGMSKSKTGQILCWKHQQAALGNA
jgi:hypothetical protein